MANILALAQDIADELSLARPSQIVGNTSDNTAQKILRHMTRTLRQIANRYSLQALRREKTFVTVATADQSASSPIPTDFLRFVPNTMFNRVKRYRVVPMTPEEWQSNQAALTTRVYDAYVQRGNSILMAPIPPAGQTIAYEYITRNIGTDSTGATARLAFASDLDLPYLSDELVILGTVWRYNAAEGNDYAETFREYEMCLNDLIKNDGGRRMIDMGGMGVDRIPIPPRTPDTLVGLG